MNSCCYQDPAARDYRIVTLMITMLFNSRKLCNIYRVQITVYTSKYTYTKTAEIYVLDTCSKIFNSKITHYTVDGLQPKVWSGAKLDPLTSFQLSGYLRLTPLYGEARVLSVAWLKLSLRGQIYSLYTYTRYFFHYTRIYVVYFYILICFVEARIN